MSTDHTEVAGMIGSKKNWNIIEGNWNDHKCWRSSSGLKFSSSTCKVTHFGVIRSSAMAGDKTWQEKEVDMATDHRKIMSQNISLCWIREDIFIGEENLIALYWSLWKLIWNTDCRANYVSARIIHSNWIRFIEKLLVMIRKAMKNQTKDICSAIACLWWWPRVKA